MTDPRFTPEERAVILTAARSWRLTVDDAETLLDNIAPGPGDARPGERPDVRARRLQRDRDAKRRQ